MDNSRKCLISGQTERVRDVSNTDRLTDHEDTEHVEPVRERWRSVPIDPNPGTPRQLPLLADVHRLNRGAEPVPTPGLDLDKRHRVLAPDDEIDIAVAAAEAMRHHDPPVPAQPARRDPLSKQPKLLSRFRHGAV